VPDISSSAISIADRMQKAVVSSWIGKGKETSENCNGG